MPKIKRFPYSPILGWSSSRCDTFSICKRRYWYHYYGKYDTEFSKREIGELKDLVSVPMEIGSVVHEVMRVLLHRLAKTTEDVDRDKFFAFVRREAEKSACSKSFHEVCYGERPAVGIDDIVPKTVECMENILGSDRYAWLVSDAVRYADDWVIEPGGYGESRLDDLKVYCKADFVCPTGNGYHVIDWKTGKSDEEKYRKQLTGYAVWATYHFDCRPSQVTPVLAFLHPEYTEVEQTFDEFDFERFSTQVQAETQQMYEYCQDVDRNIPAGKDCFPMTDNDKVCASCNFRGLCFRDEYPRASM